MSIDMSGISSMLDGTMQSTNAGRTNRIQNAGEKDYSNASAEELKEVCKEFEAYFVEMVMKEVKKSLPESENEDAGMGKLKDFFMDNMITELAEQVCEQQNLGLADTMYEQMKQNYGITE